MRRYTIKPMLACLLLSALLLVPTTDALAGDKDRRGTAGAYELLIPVTARYASLGAGLTSGMAGVNGLEMLYANPAGLTLNTGTSALFSRMEYVADIGVNYFGIAQRFGANQIAFTVNAWDFGDIPLQTEASPEITSVTWDASFITAGFSFARQFTDRISAGTTVKVVTENIDDVSASAIAFDAGMTYTVGESGLRIGVALKNVGTDLEFRGNGLIQQLRLPGQQPSAANNAVAIESEGVQLPSLLNFGVSYTRDIAAGTVVTVLGNFRSNSFDQDQYSGGVELGFRNVFFLRGGFEVVPDMDLTFYQGTSFGAGVNLDVAGNQITVDYAYRPTDFFDDVQMFTVSVAL